MHALIFPFVAPVLISSNFLSSFSSTLLTVAVIVVVTIRFTLLRKCSNDITILDAPKQYHTNGYDEHGIL